MRVHDAYFTPRRSGLGPAVRRRRTVHWPMIIARAVIITLGAAGWLAVLALLLWG